MIRFLLFALLLFPASLAVAQDIHFSQYQMSPLTLNPAETGVHDGDWRAAGNFRDQWKAIGRPIQTLSASYDQPINFLPGNFSAGILFSNDQSGNIDLVYNRIGLNIAYQIKTPTAVFSIGVQPAFAQKSYSLSGISFPEQYNSEIGLFDPSMSLSENGLGNQKSYFDLNVGFLAEKRLAKTTIRGGMAMNHINQPNVSFFDNTENLPSRFIGYANVRQELSGNVFVKPSVMLSLHEKAQEVLVGSDIGLKLSEDPSALNEVYVGLFMRNGVNRNADSFIAAIGGFYGNFQVGMSYDINYSALEAVTNNRGAFEIAVIYISPSTAINKLTIPCDRY